MALRRTRKGLLLGSVMAALYSPIVVADTQSAVDALGRGDNTTAVKLFREAAGSGDTHAQVMLGRLLVAGEAGLRPDPAEAAALFRKAADSGKTDDEYVAMAQFDLAALYFSGRGVSKDSGQALKYYTQAADNGFAEAQKTLVAMYLQGTGVAEDKVQAVKWTLILAAGSKNPDLVRNVAILHQRMTDDAFAKAKAAAIRQFPALKIEETAAQALAMAAGMPHRLADDPWVAALPPQARAQHYLDAHDDVRLSQVVTDWFEGSDRQQALDWLKAKVLAGESIEVAYLYANLLWNLGNSSTSYAVAKDTAATMTTYAFAVIEVDGQKCKDATAPAHNIDLNLSTWLHVTWAYMAGLPIEQRANIQAQAINLEKKTAPLRKVDTLVCGGGMGQFAHADLAKGTEVPTPPGQPGKTVAVTSDPNDVPELKSEAEYKPALEKARAQLGVSIAVIVEKLRDAPAH